MAEQDAVERVRQRQLAERARPVVPDLAGGDRRGASRQVVFRRRRAADGLGNLALAVAAYPPHRGAQRIQASERRARERAGHRVSPDDHDVGMRSARIGEHGLERVDVAVDVVEREDVDGG